MEICRWSKQPKADAFMDFVWDIADKLIKGEAKVVPAQQPATPAMEEWASRVERISDGLDDISRRLSTVERSTSFSNYYLRLQARSGYDRTWERRAIRNVKAIASYIGMDEKSLLRKIYREMESRYGIVLNDFSRDYKRVKKISRCSTSVGHQLQLPPAGNVRGGDPGALRRLQDPNAEKRQRLRPGGRDLPDGRGEGRGGRTR